MHNQLRIIGGKWRSRKISFLPLPGLRPTTDRIRETLFNWLSPYINGANCLDLFSGSGALSFEALSRGAKSVTIVDKSPKVIAKLEENAKTLQAINAEFYCLTIPEELTKIPKQIFDIVFLDPPFQQNLIKICCEKLLELGLVNKNTLVYIESEKELDIKFVMLQNFTILQSKATKNIGYHLIKLNAI